MLAGAHHPQRPAPQVEALQALQAEVSPAGAVDRLVEVMADGQQQPEDMLGHRGLPVGGHVADGDAPLPAVIEVDVIVAGGAGGDEPHLRHLLQQAALEAGVDEGAEHLGVGVLEGRFLAQRLVAEDHLLSRRRERPLQPLALPGFRFADQDLHAGAASLLEDRPGADRLLPSRYWAASGEVKRGLRPRRPVRSAAPRAPIGTPGAYRHPGRLSAPRAPIGTPGAYRRPSSRRSSSQGRVLSTSSASSHPRRAWPTPKRM